MEKKGELLNQLAIISDLIEKVNADIKPPKIIFTLSEDEFYRIFNLIEKKFNRKTDKPKDTFKINIGTIEIIFNMNNV